MAAPAVKTIAKGLGFPEGPVWIPATGELWFVELKGGRVSKVDSRGKLHRVVQTPGPNGMKLHPDGSLWVCECARKALLRIDPRDGSAQVVADSCDGKPFLGPNDLCFGVAERCYFTDPDGSTKEKRTGALYRRARDGKIHREFDGLAYPNGLALTPDGTKLVFAETLTGMLFMADRQPDGSLGGRRPFCEVGGAVGPDGMCFDAAGNLYVAIYGDGCVRVVNPAGKIAGEIKLPGRNPTNCCFGGKDLRTLYVTETEHNQVLALALDRPGYQLPPNDDELVY